MMDSFDFTVVPGSDGIFFEDGRNKIGLVFFYTDEDDTPIDLSGFTLHFVASACGKAVLTIETPIITWDSATGRIIVPIGNGDTRELGKYDFINYSLEARAGNVQDLLSHGKISIWRINNAD